MAEITWRNVNSDMSAYQGRALEGASRSFDGMFEKLAAITGRTQAIDDKNFETGKVNLTNDALNQVMGYATPEAFAAAQKAGAMRALLGNGAMIDQQAVRSAIDSRLPQLQQRATQGIAYKNAMVDDATAPLMEQARMLAVNGDMAGAKAMLMQAQSAGARNVSQGAEYIDGRQQLGVTRERDTTRFKWDGQDQENQNAAAKDALLTSGVQRDMYRNNMANDNASRKLAEDKLAWEKTKSQYDGTAGSSAAVEKQYQAFRQNSVMSMGAYGTKEGKAELLKGLKERGVTPDQTEDILTQLATKYSKGIAVGHDKDGKPKDFLPVPVSVILEEVDKAGENPLAMVTPYWSRRGDVTVKNINKRFGVQDSGFLVDPKNRDTDVVDEMRFINKLDSDRTAGLFRPEQNKEIVNVSKGKKGKGGGGGSGFPANPKVGDEATLGDKSSYKYTAAGWVRQYKGLD